MHTYLYSHTVFGLSSIDKILKYCFCINKIARVTVTYRIPGYLNSLLLSHRQQSHIIIVQQVCVLLDTVVFLPQYQDP